MGDLSTLLEQSAALERTGKYSEAHVLLSRAISATPESDPLLAAAHNQRGIVLRMLRNYDAAIVDYQTALRVSIDDKQRAAAHINMADIHRVARSDFGAAHCSLDEALTYSGNGTLEHAQAVDQRGLVFVGQKDFASAISAYKRARELCEQLFKSSPDDVAVKKRFANVLHHLGVAYVFSAKSELVEEAYQSQVRALDIFVDLSDQQGIVNTVTTLGRIAVLQNNYENALVQYKRAELILSQTDYKRAITSLALHLSEAYLALNKPDEAKPHLENFVSGVLSNYVTPADLTLLKDHFVHVSDLYQNSGLNVATFDLVPVKFS